jgi:hypothetical protein
MLMFVLIDVMKILYAAHYIRHVQHVGKVVNLSQHLMWLKGIILNKNVNLADVT